MMWVLGKGGTLGSSLFFYTVYILQLVTMFFITFFKKNIYKKEYRK